jgi:hypothetical protein
MDEPLVDELRHRLQVLEQEKRRWKMIGITALVAFALLLVGGGAVVVGTASLFAVQVREERMRAMEAEREARMQAERARMDAERARQEAQRGADEAARREREKERP